MHNMITFNGKHYPELQAKGNAMKFAIPFFKEIIGEGKTGYDIGCNREEWKFPSAIAIDTLLTPDYDAYNLPAMNVDYIVSSHCLEHLPDVVKALEYWKSKLHIGGVLCLYLPHPVQEYWLPVNNRKHLHVLFPDMIAQYLVALGYHDVFVTGYDLNCSFYAIGRK